MDEMIRDLNSQWVWVHEFDEDNSRYFIEEIYARYRDNPYKPILINIDSYGGSVYGSLSMLDAMDAIRSTAPKEFKFVTFTNSKAMSAGALLLSHGDIRFASKNASVMIHQTCSSPGYDLSFPSLVKDFDETARLNNRILTILKDNCEIEKPLEEFQKDLSHNIHMDAFAAKEFGIVDAIGVPQLNYLTSYELTITDSIRVEEEPEEAPKPKKKTKKKGSK